MGNMNLEELNSTCDFLDRGLLLTSGAGTTCPPG